MLSNGRPVTNGNEAHCSNDSQVTVDRPTSVVWCREWHCANDRRSNYAVGAVDAVFSQTRLGLLSNITVYNQLIIQTQNFMRSFTQNTFRLYRRYLEYLYFYYTFIYSRPSSPSQLLYLHRLLKLKHKACN